MGTPRALGASLAILLAIASFASCSSENDTGSTSTSGGTGGGTTGGTGGGATTASSSSSSSGGGQGGSDPGCLGDADCAGDPAGAKCDLATGECVECLPAADDCPAGQYCTASHVCQVGCTDESDCPGDTVCDPATHQCVGCVVDTDCPVGSICVSSACLPGCSGSQPCQAGFSCCGQQCFDLDSDVGHCGGCQTPCPPPPNAVPICQGAACHMGACNPGFDDCDLDESNGCEHNSLQDGPCICSPGATLPCYNGAPGTEGVGLCQGGVTTCTDGVSWGPCAGEVLPNAELCNQLDDDCDGAIEPQPCEQCTPNTGTCNGQQGKWCKPDGLGYIDETCDPLQGTTCNPQTGKCDGACGLAQLGSSYIGCDYFPTVTANLVATSFSFAVAVSNTAPTPATVTVTKGANTVATATVAGNSVQVITLPWELTLKGPASGSVVPFPASVRVNQGAYRLRSTQPVTVYQFNPLEYTKGGLFSYSNDASILLPVNVWTGTYRVAARHHFAGGSGFYAVTAKADNTTVNVTPGPTSGNVKVGIAGIAATGVGSVVLNAGDVIEVVTNGGASQSDPNDVTGTLVSADKPVQVIGGHQCIYIPDNVGYCDHLEETMFPFETLSTTYLVTAPLIPTGGATPKVEMVRIIATKPNTSLTYDPPQAGAPASIAQAGAWVEIANTSADFEISSTEPILVVQYMTGQAAGGNSGDPSMTLAVAKDQYRDSYLFHAPTNYQYSYVNVVAPTGASITLDGGAVGGFTPIGGTGYSIARATLSNAGNGNHTITGSQAFGISVYGYGQYTSYWYPGGSNLTKLHD